MELNPKLALSPEPCPPGCLHSSILCRLVAWKESCTACLHPSLQRIRPNNDPAIRHGLGTDGKTMQFAEDSRTQGGSEPSCYALAARS